MSLATPDATGTGPKGRRRLAKLGRRWHLATLVRGGGFGLSGLLGLGVNQLVLAALVSGAGMNYLLAAVFASQGSTFASFATNETLVFRGRTGTHGFGPLLKRLLTFDLLNTGSLVLRLPVLYLLTSVAGVNYLLSNLVAIVGFIALRFFVADRWIWQQSAVPTPPSAHHPWREEPDRVAYPTVHGRSA